MISVAIEIMLILSGFKRSYFKGEVFNMAKCGRNVILYDPNKNRIEESEKNLEFVRVLRKATNPDALIDELNKKRPDMMVFVHSRVDDMELERISEALANPKFQNLPILLLVELECQERVAPLFPATNLVISNRAEDSADWVVRVEAMLEELDNQSQVIVLDDDEYFRGMEISLIDDGYNPIEMSCGTEVIDYLTKNSADVLLLDIDCYDMDVFELADKVRSTPGGAHAPIVFLTDGVTEELTKKFNEKSSCGYLVKPIHGKDMRAKIEDAIRRGPEMLERKLVVVVDDDVMTLKSIQAMLKDEYKIIALPSAMQAIKYFETKVPDIVLLDYEMPVKNGLEVLRVIRSKSGFNNVPVIMLTGNKEKQTVVSCIQCGAQGYLTKPVNSISLRLRIRQLLGVVPGAVQ